MKHYLSITSLFVFIVFFLGCGGSPLAPTGTSSRIDSSTGSKASSGAELITLNASISPQISSAQPAISRTVSGILEESAYRVVRGYESAPIEIDQSANCAVSGSARIKGDGEVSSSDGQSGSVKMTMLVQFDNCRETSSLLIDGYLGMGIDMSMESSNNFTANIDTEMNLGVSFSYNNNNYNINTVADISVSGTSDLSSLSSFSAAGTYTVSVGNETWTCTGSASTTTSGFGAQSYSSCTK